jgi:Glycosyl hydrolases family 18
VCDHKCVGAPRVAISGGLQPAPRLQPRLCMNTRLAILWASALFAAPVLPACGDGSPSDWNPAGSGSSSGAGGAGEGGVDSGAPTTGGGTRDSGPPRTSPDGSVDSGRPPGTGDDSGSEGGTSDAGPSEGGVVTPATKVTMYLPNWNGSFSSWATMIDFNKMTHLLLAFGTVSGTNGWDLGAADSDVQTLAAAAHAANVKVLVSIGGADGDITIINAYGSASNIAPLVSNLDSMVSRLNLDGVDVDLERGGMMQSGSNYPAFVSQLLSTFHPEGKLVTSALAQYIVQDANPDPTITATVQSFDFINDMIYTTNMSDYTNEANWWTSTIQLPNDKLVWGVLFGNGLSVGTVTQIATASKAYGGIMCWEYTQQTESTLWPAIQSVF